MNTTVDFIVKLTSVVSGLQVFGRWDKNISSY